MPGLRLAASGKDMDIIVRHPAEQNSPFFQGCLAGNTFTKMKSRGGIYGLTGGITAGEA